jgi:hypothetical protein
MVLNLGTTLTFCFVFPLLNLTVKTFVPNLRPYHGYHQAPVNIFLSIYQFWGD